jgi:thioredoxin 1
MSKTRNYGKVFEAVKSEDIQTAVLQNDKVVLDFTAKWCGPCKQLEPLLNQFANENESILFLKIDIDNPDCSELIETCAVKNLPTIQFYYNKEMLGDIVGLQKDNIVNYMNDLISK